jgi:uncharacterized membrane protein YGL010W
MKRGSALMIIGISIIIMNWIFSAVSHNMSGSMKGTLGYVTIVGWIIFFGGFGLRQLDKRKSTDDSGRKKKSL